jgi:serine/threonine-protein kinase
VSDLSDQLAAALAGRYRVERELGRGGMATVFLADDLRHRRRVAIKVLSPELAVALGSERFLHEIEIAAGLNHPHILPLHESGAADGLLFYVMPYAEGESLRHRLARERQLSLADSLRIARDVADALDYAHRHGVVHRDIKPENILLQEQHAVVADFGIARAIFAAGGEKLTATGVAVGTPLYMSPEQCAGGRDLDGRSDQYSLGCVLFEMLAGQPPFTGPTAESLTHQHLSVAPRPVTDLRPTIPSEVVRTVQRTLAKAAADRYRSAADFAQAIEEALAATASTAGPAGVGPGEPRPADPATVAATLAVEPRQAVGSKPAALSPARGWILAAGTAAVIALAIVAWRLGPVIFDSRTAVPTKKEWILVAEFDGPAADSSITAATRDLVMAALDQSEIVATVPRDQIRLALQSAWKSPSERVDAELARELAFRSAVRTVLEGRVGRLGKGYSLVLRLTDADSARVVVSVSDAAADEDALIPTVNRIAKRLRAELGERKHAIQATRGLQLVMTPSLEAYRAVLQVPALTRVGDFRGAIACYRRAIALDPEFASAWGYMGIGFSNLGEPDSALMAYGQALARPERLDESQRLIFAGGAAFLRGDLPGALALSEQLIQLNPQSASGHLNRSAYLAAAGRLKEALESIQTAERVRPFGPNQFDHYQHFWTLISLGLADEARTIVPRFMGRNALHAPLWMAEATGQWSAAESLATALRNTTGIGEGDRRTAATILAAVQASRGQVSAADQALREVQSVAETSHDLAQANSTRWDRLRLSLFSRGVAVDPGSPGSWDTTTAGLCVRGAWAAATGDSALARRLPATIRKRSAPELARQGFLGPGMVEAWLAARGGDWQGVLRFLGPAALQGRARGHTLGQSAPLVRWMVAEAHAQLDRPDSAAAYFERVIAPPPEGGTEFEQVQMASSFAHQRLVLLYARMGRLEDARRHWAMFSDAFTRPDPEMRPLIEQARAALGSAEGRARTAQR